MRVFICLFILATFLSCQTNTESTKVATTYPNTKTAKKMYPYFDRYLERAFPDKEIDIEFFAKTKAQIHDQLQLGNKVLPSGFYMEWETEGPYNLGGRVTAIAVHPQNENIIFLGYSSGGLYKTINGGSSWYPVFDDKPFLAIGDVSFDPVDPEIVYVGTGDPVVTGFPHIGDGLYKSMDGGESFEKFGLDQQRVISKIAIDESDPQRMFVSSMGMPFFKDANSRGIYSTLDGGQTWNQVYSYSDSTGFTDVIINPERPEYVYASAWDRVRRTGYSVVTGYGSAFYMSRDGGQTWTNDLPSLPQGPHCKTGIAICENEPSNVFVLYVAEDYSFGYLYRSRDFGETWEEVPTDDLPEELMYDFGWFFGKMAVNPENADHIFISGVELFETNDGGQNWRRAMPPWFEYEVHADCHEVIFEGSNIYLATDGGAYKRPINGGEYDWQDIENIATNLFYRVAHNPHYSDRVYGGMQDNGTSGGNKNIAQWGRLYGGDGFQPVFNPTDQNHYFLEAQNGNIAYSPDGFFLDAADIGIPEEPRPWDMQYFMSVHNPNVMYTATDYVYKCSDSYAPFWEPISDKLSSADFTATGITESPNGPGLLYACFNDASVWRTLNDGQNWTEISDGLPYRYPTSIKASPSFAPTVYVTFSGYGHYDTQAYVFRSDDLGMSWVDITGDLPAVPANDIFIIPGMDDKVIFIATEVGVYGTIDAGASWSRLGTNMPLVITNDLDYNPITNTLIAGTFGKSILTYELDGLVEPSNTADLAAQTITLSPNPTSGLMTVSIAGNHFSGGCEVFDNKGSLVLKSSMDRSGNIDVSALKAGIYFLRVLTADGVSSTDRFVKL